MNTNEYLIVKGSNILMKGQNARLNKKNETGLDIDYKTHVFNWKIKGEEIDRRRRMKYLALTYSPPSDFSPVLFAVSIITRDKVRVLNKKMLIY